MNEYDAAEHLALWIAGMGGAVYVVLTIMVLLEIRNFERWSEQRFREQIRRHIDAMRRLEESIGHSTACTNNPVPRLLRRRPSRPNTASKHDRALPRPALTPTTPAKQPERRDSAVRQAVDLAHPLVALASAPVPDVGHSRKPLIRHPPVGALLKRSQRWGCLLDFRLSDEGLVVAPDTRQVARPYSTSCSLLPAPRRLSPSGQAGGGGFF